VPNAFPSTHYFEEDSRVYHGQNHTELNLEELPELDTEVAISGSCKQQEVGGGVCLSLAAGIAVYLAW
jgi:hypothetical protein